MLCNLVCCNTSDSKTGAAAAFHCFRVIRCYISQALCGPCVLWNRPFVSWPDGMQGNLNQVLVLAGLVLCLLVVFINCCWVFVLSLGCGFILVLVQSSDWLERSSLK